MGPGFDVNRYLASHKEAYLRGENDEIGKKQVEKERLEEAAWKEAEARVQKRTKNACDIAGKCLGRCNPFGGSCFYPNE